MGSFAAHLDSQRCAEVRAPGRCQLLVDHDGAHAAMVSRAPFVRLWWNGDAWWSECESYLFGVAWEQLRWAVGFPRLLSGTAS